MRLSTLLANITPLTLPIDPEITGLTLDSRQIKKGDLFIAVKGRATDGRNYIAAALSQGAAAVLVQDSSQDTVFPLIAISNLTQEIGRIASRFYDYPAKKLRLIGVTGTNGKTSCTHFTAQLLHALQIPCGIIGTLGNGFYGNLQETALTTPDAITLQALLHSFTTQAAAAAAVEVSSHSIDQGRVNDLAFEMGVFTNLTQDHLDYHGDMATYARVKQRFLTEFPIKHLILNADDTYTQNWLPTLKHDSLYTYSVHGKKEAHIYTENNQFSLEGIYADLKTPWGNGKLYLPLLGEFNLSNALAVFAVLSLYGIPFDTLLNQFAQLKPVSGRMQTLGGGNKPLVVVDYAHTPDALEKVLQTLRRHTKGKLICVFGCGGDRDQIKRPQMATIAEKWADKVIVTNDNPRHENPADIVSHILTGFIHPQQVIIQLERSQAIQHSIQLAAATDCILIAGKGAEHYQQIGDEKIPFDDCSYVRQFLEESK